MNFSSRAIALFCLTLPVLLSGCATYDLTKPPPLQSAPLSVVFSNEGPSGWTDLPIGTYTVPNSNIIVSGHQRGGGIGMLFGVVGVLAQGAVNSGIGKDAVHGAEPVLHVDLTAQAQTLTKELLASGRFGAAFNITPDPNGPTLQVAPFTVLTFANDTDVRPYVILKVTLKPTQAGGAVWTTRYISSAGGAQPLEGANSLTADGGALLKSTLALELDRAVKVMLDDVAHPAARDGHGEIYVESALPYVPFRMGQIGPKISDDGPALVYVPKVADAVVFAGVHILDKAGTTYRAPGPDDKPKMLEDGQ